MKLLEKLGNILFDTGPSNIFLDVSSGKGNKSKNKLMGLHQTKKLLHSEENYQQDDKAAHWRDDIYKQYIQ